MFGPLYAQRGEKPSRRCAGHPLEYAAEVEFAEVRRASHIVNGYLLGKIFMHRLDNPLDRFLDGIVHFAPAHYCTSVSFDATV